MYYIYLIIAVAIGFVVGAISAGQKESSPSEQSREKVENKEKILGFMSGNEKVTNNDIQKLLGVSDATATRYLNELEEEGKIEQVGTTGHAVYYILK